jgi:hypothetical protein
VLFLDETNVAGPLWGGGAAIRAAMSTRPRSGDAFPHQWKNPQQPAQLGKQSLRALLIVTAETIRISSCVFVID